MNKKTFLVAFLMAACSVHSFAQNRHSQDSLLVQSLDEVVVTATGTTRLLKDSPVPISIISSKQLRSTNAVTLGDALQKLSSSFTSMTNGMGTTISLNGMPDNYFIFLENGRRLDGDNAYSRIDLGKVQRIEILSGASAALYGTNAIGGVVNIITEGSTTDNVNIVSDTKFDSKNRFTQSVNVHINSGRLSSSTNYRHQRADSWQLSPYEINKKDELVATDKIASTGFSNNVIGQGFDFKVNNRLTLNTQGSFYANTTDRPYSVYKYNLHHESYTYGAGARYRINDKSSLLADYFSDNYTSTDEYFKDDDKNKIAKGESVMNKRTHYHNANVKGIFNLGKSHLLSTGSELIVNTLHDPDDNISFDKSYTLALFAQDEIKIAKNLQGVVGVRYSYHENFKSYATPNVSLMYSLGQFRFRGSYASGFRTPTLSELYASSVSLRYNRLNLANPDLKPEKSDYFSVSTEFSNKYLSVSVTGFKNNIRDMINYIDIASGEAAQEGWGYDEVRKRENVSRAEVLGLTVSANANLGKGFALNASYTNLDTKDIDLNQAIDKSIEHAATLNAQWGHTWNKYRLNVNVNGRINGERFSKSYGYAPSHELWDISTRHAFDLGSIVLEPGIGIQNILDYTDDRPWNSNYGTLTPGRSLCANLRIIFN